MKRRILFLLILLGACLGVQAQKGLSIQKAFDELAVKKNVTEVVMGPGRLKNYNLSYFHSLEIKAPTAEEKDCIETLLKDDAAKAELHEETAEHRLYELPQHKGTHYYIFYRHSPQSLILIYIEGKASLKQIESYFRKKHN